MITGPLASLHGTAISRCLFCSVFAVHSEIVNPPAEEALPPKRACHVKFATSGLHSKTVELLWDSAREFHPSQHLSRNFEKTASHYIVGSLPNVTIICIISISTIISFTLNG